MYNEDITNHNFGTMTTTIQKTLYIVLALALVLATVTTTTAFAKGPHLKATGDVTWTSAPGVAGYRTVFNAHQDAPGKKAERGNVTLYHPDGGMRTTDVECVLIEGNEAWFGGTVTAADGAFAGQVGDKVLWWVEDNGQPGADPADKIGATRGFANPCAKLGDWTGGGTVTDGNLVVHNDVEEEEAE